MASIEGTNSDELLVGSIVRDEIRGRNGKDVILALDGADDVDGGGGADVIDGGHGKDAVAAGAGNDTLISADGNDGLDGGTGDDVYILHGTADDRVTVSDTEGVDTFDLSQALAGGVIDLRPGAVSRVDNRKIALAGGDEITLPLDLVLAQDLSGSFGDDISTVRTLAPNIYDGVTAVQSDTEFAVTSFIDKPISPFGSFGDFVYNTDQALSSSRSTFIDAINSLSLGDGNDFEESQLSALLQISKRGGEIGFRAGSFKVVVLFTDADYHVAGDFDSPGVPANDGDGVLEGSPAGTGEDYPSINQVRAGLLSAGIVPIFAVTSGVNATYQDLVDQLGFGAVVPLSSNSSDIVEAITSGLSQISETIIENAIGTKFADEILGNGARNKLVGLKGDDTIEGKGGADTLCGDSGEDSLLGGAGADTIKGGDDRDTLRGEDGGDMLRGDKGADLLNGGSGSDTLKGGNGGDRIIGGGGRDTMQGDAGDDVFVFANGSGKDKILDFDANGEKLDMKALGISFGDLTITSKNGGADTLIEFGGASIVLKGVDAADITAADFLF